MRLMDEDPWKRGRGEGGAEVDAMGTDEEVGRGILIKREGWGGGVEEEVGEVKGRRSLPVMYGRGDRGEGGQGGILPLTVEASLWMARFNRSSPLESEREEGKVVIERGLEPVRENLLMSDCRIPSFMKVEGNDTQKVN